MDATSYHIWNNPACQSIDCLWHHRSRIQYFIIYSVQIYSIVAQAGHHFTKNVGGAILDLLHLAWLLVAIFFITKSEDLCDRYFPGIVVGLGFTMSRTVSYTLLCSVANMKFQQFQPSVLIYCIVYPGNLLTT